MRCAALLLAAAALTAGATAEPIRPGQLVERVACAANPAQEYALYVPSSYDPKIASPILFAMDARGNALQAMTPFRAAAERHGTIVASSWNTSSDGPMAPNVEALNAMWKDTRTRLAIDGRRVYAAGFSGTARAAVALAVASPGTLTGVIASGAGYPEDRAPAAGTGFFYFVAVGRRDFNYSEVQRLEPRLRAAGMTHRIEEFDGGHEWMPPATGERALAWLGLMAVRRGLQPADPARTEASWNADLNLAGTLDPVERHRLLAAMLSGYEGTKDTSQVKAMLAALETGPELPRARSERDRQLQEEKHLLDRTRLVLSSARDVRRAIRDLRIDELRKRNDDVASRVLNTIIVQTSFYLPAQMRARKEFARAALLLGVAAEIAPESAWIAYELAAAHAENDDRASALASLRRAMELGLAKQERIGSDPRFAKMRETAEFRSLLAPVTLK